MENTKHFLINPDALPGALLLGGLLAVSYSGVFSKNPKYQIIGMTATTGTIYEIFSRRLACNDSMDYQSINGLEYTGDVMEKRTLRTLNPNIHALWFGIFAGGGVSSLAGIVIAHAAQSDFPKWNLKGKITPYQLLPYQVIGAAAYCILNHLFTTKVFKGSQFHLDIASKIGKKLNIPKDKQDVREGWALCDFRNGLSYLGLLLGTALLIAALIRSRQGHFQWRPLSFSAQT